MKERIAALSLALVVAALGVSACGLTNPASSASASGPTQGAGCLSGSPAKSGVPVVVVAIDSSANDHNAAAVADQRAAFATVAAGTFNMHADLMLATFGASPADDTIVTGIDAVGQGPNSTYQQASAACMEQAIEARFSSVADQTAPGTADVLGGIGVLTEDLKSLSPTSLSVVVLGPAIPSVSPLDLTDPTILASDPVAGAQKVAAGGLSPHGHIAYYLSGLAGPAGPPVSGDGFQQLSTWWWWLTHKAGGSLHAVDPTGLTAFPSPALPQPPATKPVHLEISQVGPGVTVTAPAALLFAFGSSQLSPTASGTLDQVLATIQAHPGTVWTVNGYTDDTGDPGFNQNLSLERAQAVTDWLEANGAPAGDLVAVGHGATDPVASNATAAGRSENRRVTMTGTLGAGS
jgi:outer membrane protein OmpA-like peptidoglycan-associated protein